MGTVITGIVLILLIALAWRNKGKASSCHGDCAHCNKNCAESTDHQKTN